MFQDISVIIYIYLDSGIFLSLIHYHYCKTERGYLFFNTIKVFLLLETTE